MSKFRALFVLAAAAVLGTGCARYTQGSEAGDVIDPVDASKSVVLHVDNASTYPMELRAILQGRSQFIGSVSGSDTTSILLDPSMFPTAILYIAAIPPDGHRAVVGPLAAGKGDKIRFSIAPVLDMSRATVIH